MKLYDNDAYREEFMALVYGLLMSDGTNDRANQIIDAFDCAPEVEAEPILPNDPLTLEELREMEGEPVWVCTPENPFDGCYGVVRTNQHWEIENWFVATVSDTMFFAAYGKTWIAYRRRPEEV